MDTKAGQRVARQDFNIFNAFSRIRALFEPLMHVWLEDLVCPPVPAVCSCHLVGVTDGSPPHSIVS